MRLRDLQHILDTAQLPRTFEYSEDTSTGFRTYHITEGTRIRRAVLELRKVPALAPSVAPILENPVFMSQASDPIVGDRESFSLLIPQLQALVNAVELLRLALKSALPPERSEELIVQIPEPESLDKLEAQVGDLRRFFELLSRIDIKDAKGNPVSMQPSVMAFDSGSFYIELFLGSLFAIKIVGSVMDAAAKALTIWEQYKQTQARIAMISTLTKEAELIFKMNEKIRDAFLTDAVDTLGKSEPFSRAHGEAKASLHAAVSQGMELFEKRMIFLPPASAPTDIKKAFPAPEIIERLLKGDPLKLLSAQASPTESVAEKPREGNK